MPSGTLTAQVLGPSTKMDRLSDDPCCKISYALFSFYGHMRHRPLLPRLISTFAAGFLLSLTSFMQIMKIYEDGMTLEILLNVLPPTTCTIICFAIIVVAAFNGKKHDLLNRFLTNHYNEERSKGEDLIKEKYLHEMKFYVMCYSAFMSMFVVSAISWSYKSQILDVILPLNESRPREFLFEMHVFLNTEKHFYTITLFQNVMTIVSNMVAATIQNVFIIVVHLACSMFAITGHRVESLTLFDDVIKDKCKYQHLVLCKMIACIRGHHAAIQVAQWIHSTCNVYLFFSLLVTTAGLTFSLAAVTNPNVRDLKTILLSAVLFGQYFLISLLGQKLMDTSTEIPDKVCASRWYNCPVMVRKLLTFLILRSQKPSTIVMSSLFVLSVENFCSVIRTAVSFCMVLRQFQ